MILNLALVAILLIVSFAVGRGGLLQAMGMFFAVLVAASLASAWYEPFAAYLEKSLEPYRYFLDIAALWFLFAVIVVLFGAMVQLLTKRPVAFPKPVELIGCILVGLMAGWTVTEFAAFTLHTAPLRAGIMPGQGSSMLFGLKPDRCWLWWMRGSSRNGPFAIAGKPFDPTNDFVERYAAKWKQLSADPVPDVQPPAPPPAQ